MTFKKKQMEQNPGNGCQVRPVVRQGEGAATPGSAVVGGVGLPDGRVAARQEQAVDGGEQAVQLRGGAIELGAALL